MNYPRSVLLVIALGAAAVSPARAQLVHIEFSSPDNLAIFTANHASTPWNKTVGAVTQLDIYYDLFLEPANAKRRFFP
jgi:hypothetical protein